MNFGVAMYEFWHDYVKPKYNEKTKSFYTDTDSCILVVKTKYIYENIANDDEKRFDDSNYELERPLPN